MSSLPPRLPEANALLADDLALAAAAYAALGLDVFLIYGVDAAGTCRCGKDCGRDAGKHPCTTHGLLDATRDLTIVRPWWRRRPDANIGIPTGPLSGIWVLDVDPAHGGLESIARLEAEHGTLEPTWCVETGGNGLHLWFRREDEDPIKTRAGRLGAGLDVRGDGGYVVAPPSRHRSGRRYRWADAWHPARIDLAPAPPWLLGLVRSPGVGQVISPDDSLKGRKIGGNHSEPLPEVITEGARNATLTSLAGVMRRKGCGERAIVAALLVENAARCRPRLLKDEVVRIAHSIGRYAPEPEARLVRGPHRARSFVEFVDGKAVAR